MLLSGPVVFGDILLWLTGGSEPCWRLITWAEAAPTSAVAPARSCEHRTIVRLVFRTYYSAMVVYEEESDSVVR